ncbi:hypothetical protein BH23VER1_BH23VER1_21090 [soil metagenome]
MSKGGGGGRGRWVNALPEDEEAEEEFDFLVADYGAGDLHRPPAARAEERVAAPHFEDGVAPEGAHVAGPAFGEDAAEHLPESGLAAAGLSGADPDGLYGSDPRKVALAKLLWKQTSVSQGWIAERLAMRRAANVSRQLRRLERREIRGPLPPRLRAFVERNNVASFKRVAILPPACVKSCTLTPIFSIFPKAEESRRMGASWCVDARWWVRSVVRVTLKPWIRMVSQWGSP